MHRDERSVARWSGTEGKLIPRHQSIHHQFASLSHGGLPRHRESAFMTSGGREFLKWLAAIFMTGDHALKILVFGYVQCPARSYIIYRLRAFPTSFRPVLLLQSMG